MIVSLLLLAAASVLLAHQLREYHWPQVMSALRAVPAFSVGFAVALTALNYLILTIYDVLGLRFVGKPLPYRRTAFASFVSYAFAHSAGASFLSGTAMRLHLYTAWGLSPRDVAGVAGLNAVTFWLGILVLLGLSFLVASSIPATALPAQLSLPSIGAACLIAVGAYLLVCALAPPRLGWRRWRFRLPSVQLALTQVCLSSIDWVLAAGVLFVLLPPPRPVFSDFVVVFVVAQVAGVASHVPGGLGVFELILLEFFPGSVAGSALLASLLAYRAVYYLLPLLVATALLAAREAHRRRTAVARVATHLGRWLPVPQVLAATCFLSGIVLLASGATPAATGRLGALGQMLPLAVVELSHFAGSLAGASLLLLARGLQRRLDGAWLVTVALLVVGVLASFLKGFDYEEAILCAVVLAALLPCRRQFFRSASLMDEPFSVEWVVAILLVMIGIGWLLLFSYRHVEYSRDLWWQFELSSDAPRSLRATVGAMALLAGWGAWRLMRPATPLLTAPTAGDMADVAGLLAGSPRASACLALLGDKHFLFDAHHSGFVMYGIAGRSWIALGDPVAPPDVARNLVWRFRELSDRHGGWTVFYEVGPEHLPLYLDVGLELRKLGEKARVSLDAFSLEGGARKALRIAHRRAERDGLRFEVVPAEGVDAILPELRAVSNAWLAQKHTREKGFSLGCFDPNYLRQLPVAVVRRDGAVVAFANLLAGADHQEIACDLMRYRPGTHPSLMEFLFVELLVWSKAAGWQWFDLGMAPFSGLDNRALAPLWSRFGALVFKHGENFYNFQGLRLFKEKFHPVWEPRYLASPGGVVLPRVLANVATLVSGGLRGLVVR